MEALQVRVAHKMVDDWHVFTSPDVPELYSGNVSRDAALKAIPSAVAMIRRVQKRPPAEVRVVELEHA